MDCDGEGAMSDIVTGLEWILENLELPAVVLMSIGGDATLLLDQACEALITAGATVVVAAGNDDEGMGPKPVMMQALYQALQISVFLGTRI